MSIDAMCAVQKHSKAKGIDYLVLLTLGDCADHFGVYEFDGSVKSLAKRAHISPAEAKASVRRLIESGDLLPVSGTGPSMNGDGLAINLPESGYSDLVDLIGGKR